MLDRLRGLDRRRVAAGVILLLLGAWYLPGWLWPYRHVVNLGAPGDTVVVLGDSIPAGFGDGVEHAWPTLVARRLGAHMVNLSVAGDTTAGGMARLDAVLAERPRLVVVELGGNDLLTRVGAGATKDHLDAIFTRIQQTGAMVAYVSVPAPLAQDYDDAWVEACRQHGVWYVRNVLRGIIGTPSLMYDSIHPNAAGHEQIADRMTDELGRLLEAGDRRRGYHR